MVHGEIEEVHDPGLERVLRAHHRSETTVVGGSGAGGIGGGGGTVGTGGGFARVYVADFHTGPASYVVAQAAFFPVDPLTRTTLGPCKIASSATAPAPRGPFPSAGDVTISVAGRPTPIVLRASTDGGYYSYYVGSGEHVFVSGREAVAVTATGGAVPAFSASLIGPTRPALRAYPIPDGGIIDRSQHITVEWTDGGPELLVGISASGDAGWTFVECRFPAAMGSGTVLATVLQSLPAGTGSFSVGAVTTLPRTAGAWTFDVDAIDYVINETITLR